MSKILCDTNILILSAQNKLSPKAKRYIADSENILYYSAAAIWELTIKVSSGKLPGISPIQLKNALDSAGYLELPITATHALSTGFLKDVHKDPFDRIMIAQALAENMLFLTTDGKLDAYTGLVIRC